VPDVGGDAIGGPRSGREKRNDEEKAAVGELKGLEGA